MFRRIACTALVFIASCVSPSAPPPVVRELPAEADVGPTAPASTDNPGAAVDLCRGAFEARMSALAERCTDAERSTALLREQVRSWEATYEECTRKTMAHPERVTLARTGIAACTKALRDAVRRDPKDLGGVSDQAACLGLLIGSQVLGAACSSDVECIEGLHCRGDGPDSDGTCAEAGDIGDACDGSDAAAVFGVHRPCGASAFCDGNRCRAKVGTSERCARRDACVDGTMCRAGLCVTSQPAQGNSTCGLAPEDCATGFYCARPDGAIQGHCAEQRVLGDTCENDSECAGRCSVGTGRQSERFGVEVGACIPVCSRG